MRVECQINVLLTLKILRIWTHCEKEKQKKETEIVCILQSLYKAFVSPSTGNFRYDFIVEPIILQ